jgi:hypothetical protein
MGILSQTASLTFYSLEIYGANVTQLKAPVGGVATHPQIEEALHKQKYKAITVRSTLHDEISCGRD